MHFKAGYRQLFSRPLAVEWQRYTATEVIPENGLNTPAFRRIDDDLRAFLGRACQILVPVESDLLRLAKSPKSKREFRAMRELELQHWFWILINSCILDKDSGKSTLCRKLEVPRDFFGDLHYCKGLRDRYAHLAGIGEPVSTLQQLSDLVIVQRVVRVLGDVEPTGKDLHVRIDTLTRELSADAAALASPEEFDRDDQGVRLSEEDKTDLSNRIVQSLRRTTTEQGTTEESGLPAFSDLLPLLNDIRAEVSRIDQGAALAELRRSVQSLQQAFEQERERWLGLEALKASPPSSESGEDDLSTEQEPIDSSDLAEAFSELVARLQTGRGKSSVPRRPLSLDEARDQLIQLRRRIWRETRSGPSADGLLRKSMIDAFLHWRPRDREELKRSAMADIMGSVARDQLPYLEDVLEILQATDERL